MSRRQHTLASVGSIRIVSLLAACGLLLVAFAWPIPSHAESTTYYVTNAQGTVVAEMDTSSNVTYDATYRPYGQQQIGTPQAGPGYTGHVNDPDTGFVYMQARYYDSVGRFLSVDPIGPVPGNIFNFNRYTYANNAPNVNSDPSGMVCGGNGEVSATVQAMRDTSDGCSGSMAEHSKATTIKQTSSINKLASPNEYTRTVPSGIANAVNSKLMKKWEKIVRDGHDFNAPPEGTRKEHGVWEYSSKSGKFLLVSMPDSKPDPGTGAYRSIDAGDPPKISGYHPVLSAHTHPFALYNMRSINEGFTIMAYPQPSQADINYANGHNLPGMVISHMGDYYYMPNNSPNPTSSH